MSLIFKLTERYINMKFKDNLDNVEPCSMDSVMADRKVTSKKEQQSYPKVLSIQDGKNKKIIPKDLHEATAGKTRAPRNQEFVSVYTNKQYSDEDRSNGLDKRIKKDIWTTVYNELTPIKVDDLNHTKFPNVPFKQRYIGGRADNISITPEGFICVYGASPDELSFAENVAKAYDIPTAGIVYTGKYINNPKKQYQITLKVKSDLDMAEGLLGVVANNIKRLSETECDEGVGTAVVKGSKYAWKAIKFCISHMTEIATALQALGMSVDEIKKIMDTLKDAKPDDKKQEPITEVLPAAVVTGAKVLGTAAASVAAEKGLEKASDLLNKNSESIRMKENYSVKSALGILKKLDE